jgi:gliding motility-associated-like protein
VNGCSNTVTYYDYIDIYEVPVASFIFDPVTATTLDTDVDFTDYSTNASGWIWTFDSYGSSTDQNPNFVFPDLAGSYDVTLIAVSDNGCRDTLTKTLNIHQDQLIFVPNVITPDGDTFNEVFTPYFTGIDLYDYHLTIFNRWGEIIFESYNLAAGWNGTYGGEIVEDGVYIWHITTADIATDDKLEFFGHVTLIK